MKIKEGKTLLTVPYQGEEIIFQYPAFRGCYGDVAKAIDEEGLKRPTSSQTASLVYDAFQNPNGKYESEIINILLKSWFFEFTGNLYLPRGKGDIQNGVIIQDNPLIEAGRLVMNKDELVEKLQQNDPRVRFVPFGFKTGTQNLFELQKNPYILARYGEEGAEKIAEIASKYKSNPHLFSFDSVDEERVRMSALNWDWGLGGRLYVDGYGWDDGGDGHAFGVVPSEKAA